MNHQNVSGRLSESPAEIQPDKRWVGTLLCCLSALVTTVLIVLVTTSFVSPDGRDIARDDSRVFGPMAPADGGVAD